MADETNKDVVGARINLDTTKILPAFKVIDEGVRKNAESFKVLNAELTVVAKNYADMAKAADKVALSSDSRERYWRGSERSASGIWATGRITKSQATGKI